MRHTVESAVYALKTNLDVKGTKILLTRIPGIRLWGCIDYLVKNHPFKYVWPKVSLPKKKKKPRLKRPETKLSDFSVSIADHLFSDSLKAANALVCLKQLTVFDLKSGRYGPVNLEGWL